MDINIYKETTYRNDIQGVRAIGAILIMIYHIWFDKVSGGVDVFFVVSGYFMAGMLARSYLREGKVKPFEFWGRIIRRIAPLAYTVIATTLVLGYFLMPANLWRGSINEVLTSALHIENWQLIKEGTDYLASNDPPSPLQQFWALSLQVQFYFFLPLILLLSIKLSRLLGSYKIILFIVALIIASSFGFSIYYTNTNSAAAYFHTGTRGWEFFVGVAIFLASPFITMSSKASRVLMWSGLLLILAVGIFVPKSASYPGYIAALPVAAAGLMIAAGTSDSTGYVYKLLSSKALVYIGGISFSLYLWHWPILIYFQHYTGIKPGEMPLMAGLVIISSAFALSVFSKNVIENSFTTIKTTSALAPYIIGLVFFIPVFLSSYYVRDQLSEVYEEVRADNNLIEGLYQEDRVYIQSGPANIDLKNYIGNRVDINNPSLDGTSYGLKDGKVLFGEYGNKNSHNTILLVGGSKNAHWTPFFIYLAEKHNSKVIVFNKSACSFGHNANKPTDLLNYQTCNDWNHRIIAAIKNIQPQPKVVIANISRHRDGKEFVPTGYIKNIKQVLSFGIPVIGLRINPLHDDPNGCLWRSNESSECVSNYWSSLQRKNPIAQLKNQQELSGLYLVDFKDVLCVKNICPAVFHGRLAMTDNSHLTRSYIAYLAPALEKSLNKQIGGIAKFLDN